MQAAQAAHARRFRPLPTIKDKAAGKTVDDPVAARLASKPGTGKQRAGDKFEIDLLSGVITTATTVRRNKRHPIGQGEHAVRNEPNFSAKRAK